MKNENELKDLLDRLRGEVRPAQSSGPVMPVGPREMPSAISEKVRDTVPPPRPLKQAKPLPLRTEFSRPERARAPAGSNVIWSENKEAMLFGVLASLAAALGGVLEGLNYLAIAGTVAFMMFSSVMALTLFGYYLNLKGSGPGGGRLRRGLTSSPEGWIPWRRRSFPAGTQPQRAECR